LSKISKPLKKVAEADKNINKEMKQNGVCLVIQW
jgi:hypothetical protein